MKNLEYIAEPLLRWFSENARILPWREEVSPYRVWVSEIMLQQTRVEAVKPYFERFIGTLPGIWELAQAQEDTLLKLWEGLGYYNRVRNMQKAAIVVSEQYGGEMPPDYEKLLKLPGIGSYTAGAVASIAFGIAVPAVDGNVLRVISRITASLEDITKQSVKKGMEAELKAVMPKDQPGAFNQSLMELGATVCLPNGAPRCMECPLNALCEARKRDIIAKIPVKAPKKPRTVEPMTVFIIRDGAKIALHKRKQKGLLAGMYELPNIPVHLNEKEALEYVKHLGFSALRIQTLEESKHIFTHREWRMIAYAVKIEEIKDQHEFIFVELEETKKNYPIPSAFSAYTKYLGMELGVKKILKIK